MPAWYDPTVILMLDSGEHAFQCAKRRNKTEHERIRRADSPLAAKRAAWQYPCPPDWNRRRAHVMLTVVRAKFAIPEFRELLLSAGDQILAGGARPANSSGAAATERAATPARTFSAAR